jgi:hypothetical protein
MPLTPAEETKLRELLQGRSDILGGDSFEDFIKNANKAKAVLDGLEAQGQDLRSEFKSLGTIFGESMNELKNGKFFIGEINKAYRTLYSIANEFKYELEGINQLSLKEVRDLKAKTAQQISYLTQLKKQEGLSEELAKRIEEELQFAQELLIVEDKRLERLKEINANLGIAGQLFGGISKTLIGLGVDSEIIKQMGDDLQEAASKGKVGFKELFPIIKDGLDKALQDPLVQFAIGVKLLKSGLGDLQKAFDLFKEYNSIFAETARNIGMSSDQVKEMTKNAEFSQNAFNGNLYSAKQLAQTISDINGQLGLSVKVSAETANEFTAMTQTMGLTADESAKIYRFGLLNNMSLKDTNKSITAGIVATQKQTGVQVNAKQVFQEIGKLSAGITAKFQQNPEALAKAVAQAKALGTNLEQMDKTAESLLDFESSIENELKAELITGKQLNFERARAAALTGDQATLMQEVASQVGNLTDFQNMNVIAQKSLAEAFGMSRDEMSEMLQQQEVFNKLGDVSGKSAQEQLEIARQRGLSEEDSLMVNLQQQAAAEKLSATFDTIKMTIADLLAGPFSGLVNLMGVLSRNAWMVHAAVGAMAAISLAKTIGGLVMMAVQMGLISASAITANAAITFGLGMLVVGAAVAAGMALLSNSKKEATSDIPQMAEGGIVPASPGGTLVNVGEGGSAEAIVPLNSPKAAGMLGGGGDNSGLMTAINELRNAVNALANKPSPAVALNVSGQKLGEIVGRQPETGTNQYKNAYRLA